MASSDTPDRPNVLVFFTDQQRWDTAGCYGSPMGLTPHLDRMAAGGVCFEHAYTCQPVCAPARASLQTGKYALATGVWRNGVALPPTERTLAHYFKEAGYRVGYIGKWHLGGMGAEPVPPELRGGYTDRWLASNVLEFTSHPYEGHVFDEHNRPVEFKNQYRVDALTDHVLEFIGRAAEPFFLFLSYIEPHQQNDMKRLVAPEGYAEKYRNCHVPPDLRNLPGDWMRELPDYYGMCARLDEALGRILALLDEKALTDSTIILFTSDHGCHFRTRNNEYKRCCHDGCIRIPMVFQGPGLDRRLVVPELVSLVDLPPTLLSAAGLPVPEAMQGRSMLPLLEGRNQDWPQEVFLQISEAEVGRAIRTRRWKYSVHAPTRKGGEHSDDGGEGYVERYLYDLAADPVEQVNLVGRPRYREVADRLRLRLIQRMIAAGEPEPAIEPAGFYA